MTQFNARCAFWGLAKILYEEKIEKMIVIMDFRPKVMFLQECKAKNHKL